MCLFQVRVGNIERFVGFILIKNPDNIVVEVVVPVVVVLLLIAAIAVGVFFYIRRRKTLYIKKDKPLKPYDPRYVSGKLI